MSSEFDFKQTNNYTADGNREYIACHSGMVYVFEQISGRPKTVTLRNIDNLSGEGPKPELVTLEDLPARVRGELRKRSIRYRQDEGFSLAGAMGD